MTVLRTLLKLLTARWRLNDCSSLLKRRTDVWFLFSSLICEQVCCLEALWFFEWAPQTNIRDSDFKTYSVSYTWLIPISFSINLWKQKSENCVAHFFLLSSPFQFETSTSNWMQTIQEITKLDFRLLFCKQQGVSGKFSIWAMMLFRHTWQFLSFRLKVAVWDSRWLKVVFVMFPFFPLQLSLSSWSSGDFCQTDSVSAAAHVSVSLPL